MTEPSPLDAYSATVVAVAEALGPRVAALRVTSRSGDAAGSAVGEDRFEIGGSV